jgi:hypothetical protein
MRLGWAIVALAAASALAANVVVLAPGASAGRVVCPNAKPPFDPLETAVRFLTTAVERRELAGSYRLATPALKHGTSCSAWARGRLPVKAFRDIDWTRSSYRIVAGGTGQIVLRVYLFSGLSAEVFMMELRQPDDAKFWQVGFWEQTTFEPGELERIAAVPGAPAA